MTDDASRKLFEQIQRQLEPFAALERSLGGQNALARAVEDVQRREDMLRTALGPMHDFRQSEAFKAITQNEMALQRFQKDVEAATQRFALPEVDQATKLIRELNNGPASRIAEQFLAKENALARAVEAMQTPWIDAANQIRSIRSFADLQGIGFALQTIPSFDDRLTEMLRVDLGDWQDPIEFPPEIFENALARSAFYADRGLDTALTAFPSEAFIQSLDIAGLRAAPALVEVYDYEDATEYDEKEEGFARNNAAHDRLQRFESHLRRFIDEQMTKAFGPKWTKQRVPGDIRKNWLNKREKALGSGEPERPLIAYADFTDYLPIITRTDNWRDVFAAIFCRQTSVQESLQRLYPIRNCTMHVRMITQDDELFLHVETHRVLLAIGVRM